MRSGDPSLPYYRNEAPILGADNRNRLHRGPKGARPRSANASNELARPVVARDPLPIASERSISRPLYGRGEMPVRRRSTGRRTSLQVAADRRALDLARALGRGLRQARLDGGLRQADVAARANVSTSTISDLERGVRVDHTLLVLVRAARAAGADLRAYLERATTAEQPRDLVHLRHQELIVRTALGGGWAAQPEAPIDADPTRTRAADVLLRRGNEQGLVEIWDWFEDVGAALRSWDRKLARVERSLFAGAGREAPAKTSGLWVVRATRRNRGLVAGHRALFGSRFPASGRLWLRALSDRATPMPPAPGLLWVTVAGDRLLPARL